MNPLDCYAAPEGMLDDEITVKSTEKERKQRKKANLQATKLLLSILLNTVANSESSSLRSLVEKNAILNGDFREIDS